VKRTNCYATLIESIRYEIEAQFIAEYVCKVGLIIRDYPQKRIKCCYCLYVIIVYMLLLFYALLSFTCYYY
jgi:hypothetical protein